MATTAGKQAQTGQNSTRTAVAYYRTSSAANVGPDKDSLARQREAVTAYAKAHGLMIVREFYDAAVSGADPIDQRQGFLAMLQYLHSNGARVILLETASRFARDLAVQLAGHDLLKARGIELIPVDAPEHFQDETRPRSWCGRSWVRWRSSRRRAWCRSCATPANEYEPKRAAARGASRYRRRWCARRSGWRAGTRRRVRCDHCG